jgi:hypothetical protein
MREQEGVLDYATSCSENIGRFVNDSAASYNLFRHDLAPNDMLCQPPRQFESDG